jgi:hypothetical protein
MAEDHMRELREKLIRWPLITTFALASFYFLEPYEGGAFWLLYAIHAGIAVSIGMIAVRILSSRLFLWADELIGLSVMFLFLSWIAHLGVGAFLTAPVRPALESVAPPVIALQNALTGANASSPAGSVKPAFGQAPLAWIRREIRYWNLPKEDWDNEKFDPRGGQGLTVSEVTMSISTAGHGYYEALVRNETNAVLKSVEMRLFVKGDEGIVVTLVASEPIRPQHDGKMSAPIPDNGFTTTHEAVRQWLDSRGSRNAGFSGEILGAETEPFDRRATFEQELGAWLEQQ